MNSLINPPSKSWVKLPLTYCFIILCLLFSVITVAQATTSSNIDGISSNSVATNTLKLAIDDANTRLSQYKESQQEFTLVQTSEDKEGNVLTEQFSDTPSEDGDDARWQILAKDDGFNPTIDVSNDIFFDSKNFDIDNAKLVAETANTWIFRTSNAVNVQANEDVNEKEVAKADDAISTHLLTELIIDKEHAKVLGLKIYAKQPFSPSALVKIKKFEMRLTFAQAWQDGPLIRTDFTRHIKGSYGWLYSMEDLVTTTVSEITQMQ